MPCSEQYAGVPYGHSPYLPVSDVRKQPPVRRLNVHHRLFSDAWSKFRLLNRLGDIRINPGKFVFTDGNIDASQKVDGFRHRLPVKCRILGDIRVP